MGSGYPVRFRIRHLLAIRHSGHYDGRARREPRALALRQRRRQRPWLCARPRVLAVGSGAAQRRPTPYALASGGSSEVGLAMKILAAGCAVLALSAAARAAEPGSGTERQLALALHET